MGKYALRFIAVGYVSALLLVPLGVVFRRAFADGFGPAWDAVTTPAALHAFWLTILIALIAVQNASSPSANARWTIRPTGTIRSAARYPSAVKRRT